MSNKKISWIVVPGGPGLSRQYLEKSLSAAFAGETLIYYDPFGAPESIHKDPTINEMIEQIEQVANDRGLTNYGLITHSFGNYLAIQLLKKKHNNIQAIIMLNPGPFQKKLYQHAIEQLNSRVSEEDQQAIQALSQSLSNGPQLFKKLFPYYVNNKETVLPIEIPFDVAACYRILGKVSDYDDTHFITTSGTPMIRIVGDSDFFYNEPDILIDRTIVLPNIGHFPFFEDPALFSSSVREALKKINVMRRV